MALIEETGSITRALGLCCPSGDAQIILTFIETGCCVSTRMRKTADVHP